MLAPPVAPVANVPQVPLKVTNVALDANGKPLITAESIKTLEAEAAKGDMKGLRVVMYGLADMQKTEAEKWAINYATQDLVNKHNLNVGSFQVVTVNKPPDGVAYPKPEHVFSKPPDTEAADPETVPTPTPTHETPGHVGPQPGITVAPKSPALAPPVADVPTVPHKVPLKVDQVALDANGKPLITAKSIKKLEAEAAKGNLQGLAMIMHGLTDMQKTQAKKWAIGYAAQDLFQKFYANQGNPQQVVSLQPPPQGVAHPKPEDVASKPVPAKLSKPAPKKFILLDKEQNGTPIGNPHISLTNVYILEMVTNEGDAKKLTETALGMAALETGETKQLAVKKAG